MTAGQPSVGGAGQPDQRTLTSGAVLLTVSRILVAVGGALTGVVLAHSAGGSSSVGAFNVALTLVLVATTIGTLGVDQGLIYFVSRDRWSTRETAARALLFGAGCGLLLVAAGFVLTRFVPALANGFDDQQTLIALFAIPFSLGWLLASAVALGSDNYEAFAAAPALQTLLLLLLVGLLDGSGGIAAALLISNLVCFVVVAVWLCLPLGHDARNRQDAYGSTVAGSSEFHQPSTVVHPDLRAAARFGRPTYINNVLQVLMARVDLLLLGALATTATAGVYAVAIGVTTTLWLLPQAISSVLMPRIAAIEGTDAQTMIEVKSVKHATLIALVSSIALAVAAIMLIKPIYGESFGDAIDYSLIRIPGCALFAIAGVFASTLVGRGRADLSLKATLYAFLPTLLLLVTLIPIFSGTGAALATSLGFTLSFLAFAYFYRQITGRNPLTQMWPGRSEINDYIGLFRRK